MIIGNNFGFISDWSIDSFRVLKHSFCGKLKIVCGFWKPAKPAFRVYATKSQKRQINRNHSILSKGRAREYICENI